MIYIGYVFLIILVAFVAAYYFAPRFVYSLFQSILRKRAGLHSKTIDVKGDSWPYLEGGPQIDVPLVLLHGFGGDKDNWAIFAPYITDKHWLIAPDLPGFGDNSRNPEWEYDFETQARRVKEFLDAKGIIKCHLGGNSMGGAIALRFAIDYPERLASLTLYNNAGVMGANKSELQIAAEKGSNALALESVADVDRMMDFISYKSTFVPRNFKKIFFEDANKHKELLDKIFWQIAGGSIEAPLNDRLSEIKLPTLIIWGKQDRLIDVSCAKILHNGIDNSEVTIFEETGHVPMIEKPKQAAAIQIKFLAKH